MNPSATLVLAALAQTQIETQHAFEASMPLTPRLGVTLHSRGRTNPGGLGPYQFRAGPVFRYSLPRRVSLLGGYYFAKQQNAERDVRGSHRWFGGAEATLVKRPRAEFDVRTLVERFLVPNDDFTRIRHRLRLSATSRLAPYASVEPFHDASGLRSARFSAGLRWSNRNRRVDWDAGYFYEPRRLSLGPDRHMFLTTIHLRLRSSPTRPDPDV